SGSNVLAKTTSAADGSFSFADVAPGSYEIRATLEGFRQTRVTMTVGATAPPPLTVKLLVGSVTETVTVQSGSQVVDSSNTTILLQGGASPGSPPPPAHPAAPRPTAGQPNSMTGYASAADALVAGQPPDTASYAAFEDNGFRRVADAPLSTFSIDVDTASYANVRR